MLIGPILVSHVRARVRYGVLLGIRESLATPRTTPSLHFCYPGATGLRFRPGRQPAVEPAAPLNFRHSQKRQPRKQPKGASLTWADVHRPSEIRPRAAGISDGSNVMGDGPGRAFASVRQFCKAFIPEPHSMHWNSGGHSSH